MFLARPYYSNARDSIKNSLPSKFTMEPFVVFATVVSYIINRFLYERKTLSPKKIIITPSVSHSVWVTRGQASRVSGGLEISIIKITVIE